MKKSTELVRRYLDKPYHRIVVYDAESKQFHAEVMELPKCVASGDTFEEANRVLEEVIEEWILASLEFGRAIPEPANFGDSNGKIALRISRTMHKQAAELAEKDGQSLNRFIETALSHYVGLIHGIDASRNEMLKRIASTAIGGVYSEILPVHLFDKSADTLKKSDIHIN